MLRTSLLTRPVSIGACQARIQTASIRLATGGVLARHSRLNSSTAGPSRPNTGSNTGPTGKISVTTLLVAGVSTIGAGALYQYYSNAKSTAVKGDAEAEQKQKQEKSPLDPNNFVDLKLKKVIPYNHNTSTFVFELPDNQPSNLPVASCVLVKASSADPDALKDDKGKPIVRPYTPVSRSDLPGELHFLIKRYEKGNASKYIHSLNVGDTLGIKGPIPKFPYQINQFDEVALIGGGSGITPLYQILEYALQDKANKTKFTLIFANVSEKDILLREQFDSYKKTYPDKFDVVYVVEKGEKDWKGEVGYVSKEIIKKHVASPTLGDKVKVFICGPPPQVAAVAGKKAGMQQGELGGILKELGYKDDQVFKF